MERKPKQQPLHGGEGLIFFPFHVKYDFQENVFFFIKYKTLIILQTSYNIAAVRVFEVDCLQFLF